MNATPNATQQIVLDALPATATEVRDALALRTTATGLRTALVGLEWMVTAGWITYDPTTRIYREVPLQDRLAAATRRRQEAERRALEAQRAVAQAAHDELDLADEMNRRAAR